MASTLIEATYRITTPLFCAGADPGAEDEVPEFRAPSFRGVLRYWWRALAWQRDGNLGAIQQQESRLFGSSSTGQSRVMVSIHEATSPKVARNRGNPEEVFGRDAGHGVRYLGYGLIHFREGLTRAAILPPHEVRVRLRCKGLNAEELESIRDALIALGLVGGMGARSRRGFGSLALCSLTEDGSHLWTPPDSPEDLGARIERLYQPVAGTQAREALPEITAFSPRSRHILLSAETARGTVHLQDLVGRELIRYRSWGRNQRILGNVQAEQRFDDHKVGQAATHPKRIAFGLPLNYTFSGGRDRISVGPSGPGLDRRASPLFVHLHECAGSPVAVVSFFPARFLPGNRPQVKVGNNRVPLAGPEDLYSPVHAFLDRLLDPDPANGRKEAFTVAIQVAQGRA